MSVLSAEQKQAVVRQVLQSLSAAQEPSVRIRLCARIAEGRHGLRGLLNPSPRLVQPPRPAQASPLNDESNLPPAFREDSLASLTSLRLGHELHVVVTSPRRGYLHLFNCGSSGEVRRMLPRPGESPAALEEGRAFLASPSSDLPWVEKGPCNGFPERVLAVVTAEAKPLPPSLLHPSFNDTATVRGLSPPLFEPLLPAWPAADWCWGLCEAPIDPATPLPL